MVAIDWNRVIDSALGAAPLIIAAAGGVIYKLRHVEKNQKRIEEKADGNHAAALAAIHQAGKYEGAKEAKDDSRYDQEMILKAVEQVLAVQSAKRGRRRSDSEGGGK